MLADVAHDKLHRGPGSIDGGAPEEAAVRLLLVGYGPVQAAALVDRLRAEGYDVAVVEGSEVQAPGDVVLVDLDCLRLPLDPAPWLAGALVLGTASVRLGDDAVVAAYAGGADLVLMGRVRPRELVARIRALVRDRPRAVARVAALPCAAMTLDGTASTVVVGGRTIALTPREANVLDALLRRPGAVVTRAELAAREPEGHELGSVDGVVRSVRSKLEAVEGRRRVVTVRGVGFRLLPDG